MHTRPSRSRAGYGSTETSPSSCILDERFAKSHRGCVGLLVPNMEARLVDDDDQDVPVGNSGELWVRGPNIMKWVIQHVERKGITLIGISGATSASRKPRGTH